MSDVCDSWSISITGEPRLSLTWEVAYLLVHAHPSFQVIL